MAWRTATGLFAVFAAYSASSILLGSDSCSCFGSVDLNPIWSLGLDVIVLAILLAQRDAILHQDPNRAAKKSLQTLVVVGYATIATISLTNAFELKWRPSTILQGVSGTSDGRVVILDPQKWAGNPFPIRDALNPAINLEAGHWTVLLYHHDCPKCQDALPRYERLAELITKRDDVAENVLFIEAPPFGAPPPLTNSYVYTRLADDRAWLVETPLEIQVSDGIVTLASTDLPSIAEFP